ncbi:MAG: hypothetical protein ABSH20_10025 [Tepidisphaeraceae bacterium]
MIFGIGFVLGGLVFLEEFEVGVEEIGVVLAEAVEGGAEGFAGGGGAGGWGFGEEGEGDEVVGGGGRDDGFFGERQGMAAEGVLIFDVGTVLAPFDDERVAIFVFGEDFGFDLRDAVELPGNGDELLGEVELFDGLGVEFFEVAFGEEVVGGGVFGGKKRGLGSEAVFEGVEGGFGFAGGGAGAGGFKGIETVGGGSRC